MTTEDLKFELYEQLAAIRKARKHPIMLRNFEDDLEAYLEALRQDYERVVMIGAEAVEYRSVLRDAYDGQCQRTRDALAESRGLSDNLWALRRDHAELQEANDATYEKLQDATAKLASQTESIRALLRVIKSQQNACTRFKELVRITEGDRIREQAEAHRQIMQAEAMADDRWEQLEQKQELIVLQRKAIETLTFELVKARKETIKSSFWQFLTRKRTQAKPLPKKTN